MPVKKLFIILFTGGILSLVGCKMGIWEKWMFAPPKRIKPDCLGAFFTLSTDDKKLLFELTVKKDSASFFHDSNSMRHPYINEICSYDFKTDSTTVVLSSDSIRYEKIHFIDSSKILILTVEKGFHCINLYDINTKTNSQLYKEKIWIWDATLSPDHKTIYFVAPIFLIDKKFVDKAPGYYSFALYSINTNGSGLKRIGSYNPATLLDLSIDKAGQNLYFCFWSDSITGPMELNIKSNKLTSLKPNNLPEVISKLICPQNIIPESLVPISSNSPEFIYITAPTAIYKYYEKTGKAEIFYQESKYEQDERHVMILPVVYHTSEKLIMQKDTVPPQLKKRTLFPGKRYFMILNDSGQKEKVFLPKMVKDLETKIDSAK